MKQLWPIERFNKLLKLCYVHPSTLIRSPKKWVFTDGGFLEMRSLLKQNIYKETFKKWTPISLFPKNEGIMTIANRIAALERMTIQDTLSFVDARRSPTSKATSAGIE